MPGARAPALQARFAFAEPAGRLIDWLKRRPKVLRGIDVTFAGVFGFFAFKILTPQSR